MAKASSGIKKKDRTNQQIIAKHFYITLAVYALYFLWRVYVHWDSFTFFPMVGLSLLSVGYYISFRFIGNYAKPMLDENGDLSAVNDLSSVQGTLVEYCFDVVYIQWFIQTISNFWGYIWLLYLVIPVFAAYKAYSTIRGFTQNNPLVQNALAAQGIPGFGGAQPQEGEEGEEEEDLDERALKKKAKQERKEKRMQIQQKQMRIKQ